MTGTGGSNEGKYAEIMADDSLSPMEKMGALIDECAREVIAEHGEAEWDRRLTAALMLGREDEDERTVDELCRVVRERYCRELGNGGKLDSDGAALLRMDIALALRK